MKALFVIPEYPPGFGGGISTYYGTLLPALRRMGIEVTAVVGSSVADGPVATSLDGLQIIPLDRPLASRIRSSFPAFALAPDFSAHLAAAWAAWKQTDAGGSYDVVECADWGLSFVPWIVAESGPPVLVRMHASIGQIGRRNPQPGYSLAETLAGMTEDTLLPRAAHLATYGRANQQDWARRLRREVDYVPPPFALAPVIRDHAVARSGSGLVVGRVQAWKGPATLCKALARLGRDAPTIDWIGRDLGWNESGRTFSSMLAAEYPEIWAKKLRHHDVLPPDLIRQRQAAADFVVIPSDWDVFNLGAAEALAMGALVICSNGAGASDLIQDGVNGFVFPAGDDEALAASLRHVTTLGDAERARVSAVARATVAEVLAPDKIAARHVAQLLQAREAPRQTVMPDQRVLFSPSASVDLGQAGLSRLPLRGLCQHILGRLAGKLRR